MSPEIFIECKNSDDAEILRAALSQIEGIEVADEIFAKGGPQDFRKIVQIVIGGSVATVAVAAFIVSVLTSLGYTEIAINGKIVALDCVSLEGSINAKKTQSKDGTEDRQQEQKQPKRGLKR